MRRSPSARADPDTAADRLLERGVEVAIVKRGGDGVLVAWSTVGRWCRRSRVDVVCGLGAGDAFGGALCHGLLSGWDPRQMVEYANAAGAIVAARLLCSDAMPFDDEVGALLGSVRCALDDATFAELIDVRVHEPRADRHCARRPPPPDLAHASTG